MPQLTLNDTVEYFNATKIAAKVASYKTYAVLNFKAYHLGNERFLQHLGDQGQETWARFLHYSDCKSLTKYHNYSGTKLAHTGTDRGFLYKRSQAYDNPPELVTEKGDNVLSGKIDGAGQCEYFANQVYQSYVTCMNVPRKGKQTPRVSHVYGCKHNWVVLNYYEQNEPGRGQGNAAAFAVDCWLLAWGAPENVCFVSLDQYLGNRDFGITSISRVDKKKDP